MPRDRSNAIRDCVVLGAGFSFGFSEHSPLMKDFFAKAKEKTRKQESLEKLLTRVEGYFPNTRNPDLEDVASFLVMRRSTGTTKRNDELNFRRLVRIVCDVLRDVHESPRSAEVEAWFQSFFKISAREGKPIISFNYDLIAEKFLTKTNLWWPHDGYGVRMDEIGRRDNPDQQLAFGGGSPSKLALFKLHGSINWGSRNFPYSDGNSPIEVGFEIQGQRAPRPVIDIETADETIYGADAEWDPFIVPPVAIKSSYLAKGFMENVWYQAQDAMSKATRIFLIGYSCPQTDTHVDAVMREALFGGNTSKKLYVVNPNANDFTKFKQRYGGNEDVELKHIEITAQEYVRRCSEADELIVA